MGCTALFLVGSAQAVHNLAFQLDGETTNTAYSAPAGSNPAKDWNDVFNANGTNTSLVDKTATSGFVAASFKRDFSSKDGRNGTCSPTSSGTTFCPTDSTTYATGSKDTLDITPGWQCNVDNNVNSKIDIMNAYATSYIDPNIDPDTGKHDHIIYFGMEKNKDNGTNDVGFWFLQGNAGCSSPGGNTAWSGGHVNGDVLVVSEYTNGGGVSSVTAYKWNNGALIPFGSGGDCKTTQTAGDSLCATTNASGGADWHQNVTTKWLTSDATLGVGNTVVPPDFFEGGINITKVFAASNSTAPTCFNTFIGNTRSSAQTTATLFDFASGQLGECSVSMTTSPSSTGDVNFGSSGSITDTATVVGNAAGGGTAPTPTGTVTFYLCSPSQLTSPDPNNPGQFVADPSGTCNGSSGTQVGSAVTLQQKLDSNNNPIVGTAVATSAGTSISSLTSLGKYCFRAHYAAAATDTNYPGATAETGNPAQECFTLVATASTSTEQKWLPQDTATVTATGGATVAGSVTFKLYESADCTGAAVQTLGPYTVDSNGKATTDNKTYYTTTKTISWRATFTSTNSVGSGSSSHCETMSVSTLNNDTGS